MVVVLRPPTGQVHVVEGQAICNHQTATEPPSFTYYSIIVTWLVKSSCKKIKIKKKKRKRS